MIYLHVPFCRSFCTYCDFFSEICHKEDSLFNEYSDAVLEEIKARNEEIRNNVTSAQAVDTLYIGGGTPSVLPLDVLKRIVDTLVAETLHAPVSADSNRAETPHVPAPDHAGSGPADCNSADCNPTDSRHADGPFEEFTMEMNPEDIIEKGEDYLKQVSDLGVNRFSLGIQSFDDEILKWMNRRHDSARATQAVKMLRKTCPKASISIDLIFGLPMLTDNLWRESISRALELAPEHISAYQLSIEEGSALAKMIADGRFSEASEDLCKRQYEMLCQALSEAGYHHYEISNFAKPGHEAVHNSAYWRRVPYVGLGPGAHSYELKADGKTGCRFWNSQELPKRQPDGSLKTYSKTEEILSDEDVKVETIMLALRTDQGLPATELYSLSDHSIIDRLISEGALEEFVASSGVKRLRIPESHFFTSDEIIRELV